MAPIVTGDLNPAALEDLVRLCVELDGRRRDGTRDAAWAALEQAVIGKAVDLLSGPGGLASFLRRRQLGARLAGPSLPLDIGYAGTVPAGIRNAVLLRDQRCRWAGGCHQPASACETSDAVKLSSCLAGFAGCVGEGGGFVVVLAGGQAVVEAAEQASEQVALGGGVPVAGGFAAVVVGAGAG